MKLIVTLIFLLFTSQFASANQDNCAKLRKYKSQCKRGERVHVNITCGGRWYRYWTPESDVAVGSSKKMKGMCVQVKYETMTMDCYDFLDYKVSLFFCRKQKKRICKKLKENGFGSVTLKWPRKRKKPRESGERYRPYDKKQGYITKPCSEVLNN